ncbi:MAG: serine hydroxymethyltransferase, partial [Patescibacteria group bacterium]|nr:serine hydroxymethyltransferase [Patescibacteria group bacterium]
SFTSKAFKFVQYGVDEDTKLLDFDEIHKLARIFKPKIIVCGATAYPRKIDFKKFGEIAKDVGAYLVADISHIAGLIVGGQHEDPFPYADVVVTTTHKTLRGPRGAIILCKEELAEKIDKAVFPGLQGGPHENIVAGMSVCFEEASSKDFKEYAKQIVDNANTLADSLIEEGLEVVTKGTDNHIILVDLTNQKVGGKDIERALENVGIVVNKNMIPGDIRKPLDPSGIRLGVPAVTTRGMKELEMKELAKLITDVVKNPQDKLVLKRVATEVEKLASKFTIKK